MSDEKKKVVKVKAKPVKVSVKVAKPAAEAKAAVAAAPAAAAAPVAAKPEPEVTKSLFEEPADAVWSKEAREGKAPAKRPARKQTLAPMPEKAAVAAPAAVAVEKPAETAVAKPAETAVAKPAEAAIAKPAEAAVAEKAAKEPSEKPAGYVPFYKKWWFWLIVAGLALALIALIVQDRNAGGTTDVSSVSAVAGQSTTAAPAQSATVPGNVVVDEATQTVTVTLPPDFFAGSSKEDIVAEAQAEGFDNCVVNNDGSVTYTMNREKQASILSDFKREIDNSITNLTTTGTSYKSITYNDNITQFDVRVDKDAFAQSETDQSYSAAIFMLGGYYQMFSGVPSDQVDVHINFIDDKNGRTFGSVSYQEAMAGI